MSTTIPDSPAPISQMPLVTAENLIGTDIIPVVKTTNPIGSKNKSLQLEQLALFIQNLFSEITFSDSSNQATLNAALLQLVGANATANLSNGSLEIGGGSGESILAQTGLRIKNESGTTPDTAIADLSRYLLAIYSSSEGGLNRTELSASGLSVKYANSGDPVETVHIDYNGIKTPRLQLTFDDGGQPSAVEDVQGNRSMTDTESYSSGSYPTEYFVAVQPGTSGFAGYDYYSLNSTAHPIGTIVMLRNVGESDLKIYRAGDTDREYMLCEIPAHGTKCFIYNGVYYTSPVWDMM